MSHFKTKSDI